MTDGGTLIFQSRLILFCLLIPTYELKQKLSLLADGIVDSLEVSSLSTSERINLLKIIAPYTIPKIQDVQEEEVREFKIEVIDSNPKSAK